MDEKWQKFGSSIIDAIILFQIYAVICLVLLVVIVVLVIRYFKQSKQEKKNGKLGYKESKKYLFWRISIIAAIAVLVFLLAPILLPK